MRYWHYVETREQDPFTIILDWTYEDSPLRDMFDDTCYDISDMEDRCERGVDTHYIARVRVFFDRHEFGSSTIGSCYASNCDPADDMQSGIGGYLDDMIAEAIEEATASIASLREKLEKIS